MNRTCCFCIVAFMTALLVLPRLTQADEPKKEPEKKKPASPSWLEEVGKALGMVQRMRESQARMKAAENLRQLQLAIPRYTEEPKKDPAKQPPTGDSNTLYHLLPYLEQSNLYYSSVFGLGGPGDRLGMPLERVGPVLVSQLKLPKDQGRVIGEVKKGSVADKAGLKQHDILLEINGKAVPASEDEFGKLLPDGKDAKIAVTVLRAGQKTEIKNVPVAEKFSGSPSTIVVPSDPQRAWEWNYLNRMTQPAPASVPQLPRGYEVISRDPVLTTVFREDKRFTARLQEGTLAITVVGSYDGKKTTVEIVKVQEGGSTERFTTMDKVPVEYRDKAARLLQLGVKKLGSDW